MIRNLKTLGVVLCAVLALIAVVASVASAANYTASSYPTTGTGESALGNDTFTTEAGKQECRSHYKGALTAASLQMTVKTKVTNCRAFGFLEGTFSMGSCDYVYTSPSGSGDTWTAATHIKCTSALEPITFTVGPCKLTIGEQSPSGTISITNNTAAGDLSLKASITGIKYTVTEDGFGCPFGGTGAKTGATFTQDQAITFDSTNGPSIDVG